MQFDSQMQRISLTCAGILRARVYTPLYGCAGLSVYFGFGIGFQVANWMRFKESSAK